VPSVELPCGAVVVDGAEWKAWRDRVWAVRGELANVEHVLERPPSDDDAARQGLDSVARVLKEAAVVLGAMARDLDRHLREHYAEQPEDP
jgi:hypothetical protein